MSVVQIEGYSILVKNVTKNEFEAYERWLETKSYGSNMGYNMYPSKKKDCVTLRIESGFNGTWFNDILPDLIEYWGEDRIIHEVEFE